MCNSMPIKGIGAIGVGPLGGALGHVFCREWAEVGGADRVPREWAFPLGISPAVGPVTLQ